MGLKIDIRLGPWSKARNGLEKGKTDILSGVVYSEEYDKLVDFTTPHSVISFDLFVREDSPIHSMHDLRGKEIIVQEGGIMYDFLRQRGITQHIVAVKDASDIVKLLASGKHDAALMDKMQGIYFIHKLSVSNIGALGIELLPKKYGFAVAEGNEELRAKLNEGLNIVKTAGRYNEIYEKWFGIYESKTMWETKIKYFLFSLLVIGLLFLGILVWTWSLRKQVKIRTAELEKSEERYRLLVENASEGVIVIINERLAFINPRAAQITGYSEEELDAKKLFEIIHPEDQNIVFDFYTNTLKREDAVLQYPFRIITKKGETRWVLGNSVKIEWEKKTGVLNIFTDITESKKLEQQFLQAQKMEAIGQLAGGVAHDFNNILTAIMGYGNLLKMNIGKKESFIRYVDNILTSAERAANLTRSLLTFSRKQIVDPKPTKVNDVIVSVEKLLSKLIGEDIEFSLKFCGKNPIVMADSNQIIQVLMNLATNARDAMPRGGRLTISTDIIEIGDAFIKQHAYYGPKGLYVFISLEDTGIGMDEKTMERIFEPFFTTKDVGKGTGLGLATVYGIVKQQNGHINVQSALNVGTTFSIYLPVILSDLEEIKQTESSQVVGGNETILVGEDEENIRKFIREVLEGYGYRIIEAVDGEDVLQKFKRNKDDIRLLILDIIMPKKSGKDAYDEIKNGDQHTKALFISGYASDFIEKQGILGEELHLLYKPIDINTLLGEVRKILDER